MPSWNSSLEEGRRDRYLRHFKAKSSACRKALSFATRSLSVATGQMNNKRLGTTFSVLSSCSLANTLRIEMFVSDYPYANTKRFVLGSIRGKLLPMA